MFVHESSGSERWHDGYGRTDRPVEEEAKRIFADPRVRERIEQFHGDRDAGALRTVSTDDAMRRLGLNPDSLDE